MKGSLDGDLKFAKFGTFLITVGQPVKIHGNGWNNWIQGIK